MDRAMRHMRGGTSNYRFWCKNVVNSYISSYQNWLQCKHPKLLVQSALQNYVSCYWIGTSKALCCELNSYNRCVNATNDSISFVMHIKLHAWYFFNRQVCPMYIRSKMARSCNELTDQKDGSDIQLNGDLDPSIDQLLMLQIWRCTTGYWCSSKTIPNLFSCYDVQSWNLSSSSLSVLTNIIDLFLLEQSCCCPNNSL